MKTPREILLQRHQDAAPKLDAIRHNALNAEFKVGQASRLSLISLFFQMETGWKPVLRLLWLELVWPYRRTWATLAAVWIALFIFNVSQRDKSELAARKLPPPSPEAIMAWRQQERLLAELIGPSVPGDVEQRKIFLPKPRTEIAEAVAV
jgi:hypothetical protein